MSKLNEIEYINKKQAEYYNNRNKQRNIVMQVWTIFREYSLGRFIRDVGIEQETFSLHKKWLGELKDRKVLDLGCFEGNRMSIYIAKNCGKYMGIDLFSKGISLLKQKLKENDCPNAKVVVSDFLSEDFKEDSFDIIFASGVMHHFKYFDLFLRTLKNKLKPGGNVITYDPLNTSLLSRVARKMYRSFQNNPEWEWPFTRQHLKLINK